MPRQFGLVSASSIADYEQNLIKKHEKTLPAKEEDRTRLTDAQSANSGPVFLTYQRGDAITEKIQDIVSQNEPYSDVVAPDKVQHTVSGLFH